MKRLIKGIVDKINTDPNAGEIFLTVVLSLGTVGIIFCLVWFLLLVMSGMPIGWIVFDTVVILFCAWTVIKMIIPMSRKAYKQIEEKRNE